MDTILICGSRNITPAMLTKVEQIVQWVHEQGHCIICGDAPGIDSAVMVASCNLGLLHRVYGIADSPRNICCAEHNNKYIQVLGNYPARDRRMVEDSDRVFGICLNKSSGTVYTCAYAEKLGKPVGMFHFTRRESGEHE